MDLQKRRLVWSFPHISRLDWKRGEGGLDPRIDIDIDNDMEADVRYIRRVIAQKAKKSLLLKEAKRSRQLRASGLVHRGERSRRMRRPSGLDG